MLYDFSLVSMKNELEGVTFLTSWVVFNNWDLIIRRPRRNLKDKRRIIRPILRG
jgi:hypothetical protein